MLKGRLNREGAWEVAGNVAGRVTWGLGEGTCMLGQGTGDWFYGPWEPMWSRGGPEPGRAYTPGACSTEAEFSAEMLVGGPPCNAPPPALGLLSVL